MQRRKIDKPVARPRWPEEHERKPLTASARPIGRPSLYLPEYCDDLKKAAKRGLTVTAWAGSRDIPRSTLWRWGRDHPEFALAMEVADGARQHAWEEKMIAYTDPKSKATGPMVSGTAFVLKNMHRSPDWGEKPEAPPTAPLEQHQHIHLHMSARAASDAYQQLLRED
jgi:hypothetical protein